MLLDFSSYSLKTIVMEMIQDNQEGYWGNADICRLFLKVKKAYAFINSLN